MPDFVDLQNTAFKCRIGANGAYGPHRAGYNGVWSLVPAGTADSLFVPEYAGLNLEHYFDAWHGGGLEVFFEPRAAPMTLIREGDSVHLLQPETPFWGIERHSTFTVREPNILDLDFRCVPRRAVFNQDTMGVFWASYIHQPGDNGIYFPVRGADRGRRVVTRFASPRHGEASSVRGRGDVLNLHVSEEQKGKLFSSVAPDRWERPFYFAYWRDWSYAVFLKSRELIRFAMSPSGGGSGNPAWDFMFLAPGIRLGEEYRIQVRCVVDRRQEPGWVEACAEEWLRR